MFHMNNIVVNEQQIQTEIDQLRGQFPETQDLYREVCVLLFFRYGVTPTANKLYQYVRRGSMSAPADALNKFWSELREKSRVRIERTDIPEKICESAGNFIAALWNEAQEAAQAGFSELIDNAISEILQFKLQAEAAKENTVQTELLLVESQVRLESALKRVSEADYLLSVNTETLTEQENAFKTLQNERDNLQRLFKAARAGFSCDLDKLNASLIKAEERYLTMEAKSMLEVDRTRQNATKLEKELHKHRESTKSEQTSYQKELSSFHNIITEQREKIGMLNGQLSMIVNQQKDTTKQLRLKERKLEMTNNKLLRLQSSSHMKIIKEIPQLNKK